MGLEIAFAEVSVAAEAAGRAGFCPRVMFLVLQCTAGSAWPVSPSDLVWCKQPTALAVLGLLVLGQLC